MWQCFRGDIRPPGGREGGRGAFPSPSLGKAWFVPVGAFLGLEFPLTGTDISSDRVRQARGSEEGDLTKPRGLQFIPPLYKDSFPSSCWIHWKELSVPVGAASLHPPQVEHKHFGEVLVHLSWTPMASFTSWHCWWLQGTKEGYQ